MNLDVWTDEEIREELRAIDQMDDPDVTPWEIEFIENVGYGERTYPLSLKQRDIAGQIIRKNGG